MALWIFMTLLSSVAIPIKGIRRGALPGRSALVISVIVWSVLSIAVTVGCQYALEPLYI
jgi:hypothetical protein